MSDAEKQAVRAELVKTIQSDETKTEDTVLNGYYDNAYMNSIGADEAELVRCTTYEDGTKATIFNFYKDGELVGSMIVKISPDGGCAQVVNKYEKESKVYKGIKHIPEPKVNPPKPKPEPEQLLRRSQHRLRHQSQNQRRNLNLNLSQKMKKIILV